MEDEEVVVDDAVAEVPEEEQIIVEEVEEIDPLAEALQRAEAAEKEITYRDAEIQNIRKRLMSEKATAIQYGGMGMARKMLSVLADIDRALSVNEDEGLTLIRTKMWSELSSDGVSKIETKVSPCKITIFFSTNCSFSILFFILGEGIFSFFS